MRAFARYFSQLETADLHGDAVREKKRKGAGMRGQKSRSGVTRSVPSHHSPLKRSLLSLETLF